MARTKSISNEQILKAARAIFLDRGVEATTAEIAEEAGVSEGTIFKRFKTKEDLFIEAMRFPEMPAWLTQLPGRTGEGELRANLEWLGAQMLDFFVDMLPKIQLAWSHNINIRERILSGAQSPPIRALKTVAYFLDQEMALGRLARRDSEVLARALIGALHHYSFAERFGINEVLPMPRSTYVRGVVSTIFDGLILTEDHDAGPTA